MTQLFLILMSLWTIQVSFSQDWIPGFCKRIEMNYVLTTLNLFGFTCTTKTVNGCSYSQCKGTIGDYPQPVYITVPYRIESMRLHFHGHILGYESTKPYDKPFPEAIKNFGLEHALCASSQLTIFPQSRGKNDDYKAYFSSPEKYKNFITQLNFPLGGTMNAYNLHLSGHSGGGKYVAGALDAGVQCSGVSVYDGIYSDTTMKALKNWHKKNEGPLTVVTVKGMDPENFVSKKPGGLKSELGITSRPSTLKVKGVDYEVTSEKNFYHFSRSAYPVSGLQAHFDVVSHIWPRELQFR